MPTLSTLLSAAALALTAGTAAASSKLGPRRGFHLGPRRLHLRPAPLHRVRVRRRAVVQPRRVVHQHLRVQQRRPEDAEINIVYSYGGDIEFWAGKAHPDGCARARPFQQDVCNVSVYFDPNNQAAMTVYDQVDKVESIVALLPRAWTAGPRSRSTTTTMGASSETSTWTCPTSPTQASSSSPRTPPSSTATVPSATAWTGSRSTWSRTTALRQAPQGLCWPPERGPARRGQQPRLQDHDAPEGSLHIVLHLCPPHDPELSGWILQRCARRQRLLRVLSVRS